MRLEYNVVGDNELVHVERSNQTARFVAYLFRDGHQKYFAQSLPPHLTAQLRELSPNTAVDDNAAVRKILETEKPVAKIWSGYSYAFDCHSTLVDASGVVFEGDRFVYKLDGQIVSEAYSARESEEAAEPIVMTKEPFRKRGLGKKTLSAWAMSVIESKRTAFYSHLVNNWVSARLAGSLKARQFCKTTAYD